ncbi:MAG TPA: ATP-binding protein [Anaeromyxobacteraceae bacterium]|nr:ATP-binding protein [Anaeromyxobacteraceae bacterium]
MPDRRLSRLLSSSAAVLTAAALVLPCGLYVSLSYQRLVGSVEAEAELDALGINRIIAVNPDLWEYEQVRLREFLDSRRRRADPERRRIISLDEGVVAESADPLGRPVITRSSALRDAGAVVGRIEISRSLRPVLLRAGLLALLLLPVAGLAFMALRNVPLRAVRQSEEALRRERDRAQKVLDVAGVAFVIVDGAGRVGLVNRRGAEILGRSEAEVTGRAWVESFVDPPDRARVAARLAAPVPPGEVFEIEYAVMRPGGERRTLSWYVTALGAGVEPGGLLASGVDITTQRRLEAQVGHQKKLEALSEMASGVAHDFNNVLTVIRGYAQVLRTEVAPGSAPRSCADEILAAAERACALTGSLLTFSRRREVQLEPVDLADLIDRSQRLLRHLVRRGVELRTDADAGPLPILGDRAQLEQVLMNLVTNARDALPIGGVISVAVARVRLDDQGALEAGLDGPGDYARVAVSDDGVGMDEETQARLFEPFFTTKEPGKGTGLGLAIAYGIVKKHGGAIAVRSEPGRGSTFTFFVPLRAAVRERSAEPAAGAA